MKRGLKLIPVVILAMSLIFGGCNNSSVEQRIAELEQKIEELEQADHQQPPQVFERDVQEVLGKGSYIGHPEVKERQTLRFQLATGDRVEGEVTISSIGGSNQVIASIRDPYGNIVLQSAARVVNTDYGFLKSTQPYPWKFAFTADTTGEYILEVNADWVSLQDPIAAHLKVTVYRK